MATKDFNVSLPLAAGALALAMMLSACSTDGGSQVGRLARQGTQTTVTPQSPTPTETPDFGDAQPALTPQPVYIEVTRETVQKIEVTREIVQVQQVEVTATPQPVPTCDPRTPAPTIQLDQSDIDAGVILRGQWACYEVQP